MTEKKPIPELDTIISNSEKKAKKKPEITKSTSAWLGKNFNQYEVVERLGQGAMAEVYKIYHPGLKQHYALKLMGSSMSKSGTISDQDSLRFEREAQVSANLKHPNIVSVIDVGAKGQRAYLIMDYVEGVTLHDYLEENKPTPEECLQILIPLADALAHAHEKNIIHRDLKPGNIMISTDGHPMLMDFGLAKPVNVDQSFTQTGTVLGTPSYMSPEQAQGRIDEIDARSDIYGLGAVFYNMLTGHAPFERNAVMATLMAVVREEVIPPSEYNKDLSPEMEELCLRALQKNPENRFASCREMNSLAKNILDPSAERDTIVQSSRVQVKKPSQNPVLQGSLAKYKVQKEIAKGGMGVVYLAEDTQLKRQVAIKILHSRKHASQKENQRFVQEAQIAAKLSHGRLITVFEVGECEEGYFIAMEYFPAKTLEQLIRERESFFKDDIKYSCILAIKILEGLIHAHQNKIIHRDLKPANILVKGNDLKITDFGLAREITSEEKLKIFMGTPIYCSPEQIQCKALDFRADLYSIGIMLYEMLTGTVPFRGKDFDQLKKKIIGRHPKMPRTINKKIPENLQNIILTAIAKNKDNRYGDAEDFKTDLQRFLQGKPIFAKAPSLSFVLSNFFKNNKIALTIMVVFFGVFLFIASAIRQSSIDAKEYDFLIEQIGKVDQQLIEANELKKNGLLRDALQLAGNAKKMVIDEKFVAMLEKHDEIMPAVDKFIESTKKLRDIRLNRLLTKIEELKQKNNYDEIARLIPKVKRLKLDIPKIKDIETWLSSDLLEINFRISPKDASYKVYEVSKSKSINFDNVVYEGEVKKSIQVPQDNWYLVEFTRENYFPVRLFLYSKPKEKYIFLRYNMLSQEKYADFRNMIYIPNVEAKLGPVASNVASKAKRYPLSRKTRKISHFLIDRNEVTNLDYKRYLDATNRDKEKYWPKHWHEGKIPKGKADHPVSGVERTHAKAYAKYMKKRLPRSEQLELAALGTDSRKFPWGNISAFSRNRIADKNMVHMTKTRELRTVAVGTVANDMSPYGVMDLGGNVREWTRTIKKDKQKFYIVRGGGCGVGFFCSQTDQFPLWSFRGTKEFTGFRCIKEIKE